MMPTPVELICEQQALDVGYEEGRERRKLPGVKDEHCADHRKIFVETTYPFERGPQTRFYEDWRRAFDAGFLGEPKLSL